MRAPCTLQFFTLDLIYDYSMTQKRTTDLGRRYMPRLQTTDELQKYQVPPESGAVLWRVTVAWDFKESRLR